MGQGIAAETIYFLGDFTGRLTPTDFAFATAYGASEEAARIYGRSMQRMVQFLDTDDLPVAEGINSDLQKGSPAGSGLTFPGSDPAVLMRLAPIAACRVRAISA